MKIVFASTPSQEEEIIGLVRYIYSKVFPLYFTDKEINEFQQLNVLNPSVRNFEDFSTLSDAFHVMTSLQTLISILESSSFDDNYSKLFNENAENLQGFGLYFPFEYEQFAEAKSFKTEMFSAYTKAANELLI